MAVDRELAIGEELSRPLLDPSFDDRHETIRTRLTMELTPLAAFVANQSDSFVRTRHAELSARPEAGAQDRGLRIAYARESDIRAQLGVAQGVERSIADPSRHILDRLGPPPERGTQRYEQWEELARGVSERQLESASAQLHGHDPPERDPAAERDLDNAINEYRADRNTDPPTLQVEASQQAAVAAVDQSVGHDLF